MSIDKSKPYILTIKQLLTQAECQRLIDRIEAEQPTTATVNTIGGARVNTRLRNNERVMFDDAELAAMLVDRVKDQVPAEIHGMQLVGANEKFRCYRYKPGMRFAPHQDGAFHRNEHEQSWYTFMVYLNDSFIGGKTTFIVEPSVAIQPETGMALLFQHQLIHEGSVVHTGVKYVLRTDLMYRRQEGDAKR